jgi:hypothetical protein
MLTDEPIGRISTTSNQRVLRTVGALCYHKYTQHRNDFIEQRDIESCLLHLKKFITIHVHFSLIKRFKLGVRNIFGGALN